VLNPLGTIFGVVIALAAGFVGLVANSSEFGPVGPSFDSFSFLIGFYVVVSLIIGFLAGKYWKITILSSWGSVLTGLPMFLVALDKGPVRYTAYYFTGFIIVPLICLLFGYLGSILSFKLVNYFSGRFQRKSKMVQGFEILAYVWLALLGVYLFLESALFGFWYAVHSAIVNSWQSILALTPGILLLILARYFEKKQNSPKP